MPLPNIPIPKLALSRNQIIIVGAGALLILGVALAFFFSSGSGSSVVPVSLTVWGTDPATAFAGIIGSYKAVRPNVTVTYRQVSADNYDDTLLNALAAGSGPDVFMIGNHDAVKRSSLLSPADPAQLPPATMGQLFPSAVMQDFVIGGKVYAMPLYMDTLSLVYNRDAFDQAGIATPPATWQDFNDDIPKLRTISPSGQIVKAAAGIGGSEKSVRHATDLLNLLMIQNGAEMSDATGRTDFGSAGSGSATDGLKFYLQFVNAGSPLYTWNDSQPDSLESFLQGNTAMAFAYASDIADFTNQGPFLNFGVAAIPQISADHAVNYPSYQGLAVALRSPETAWSWDFVAYASSNATALQPYLTATGRTPALRSLLGSSPYAGTIAAKAALTARSWAIPDYAKVEDIFSTAITDTVAGASTPEEALNRAQDRINQLFPL
jgi:ABC-type glycerol-3-phosphate transport system substrate-binding protein